MCSGDRGLSYGLLTSSDKCAKDAYGFKALLDDHPPGLLTLARGFSSTQASMGSFYCMYRKIRAPMPSKKPHCLHNLSMCLCLCVFISLKNSGKTIPRHSGPEVRCRQRFTRAEHSSLDPKLAEPSGASHPSDLATGPRLAG